MPRLIQALAVGLFASVALNPGCDRSSSPSAGPTLPPAQDAEEKPKLTLLPPEYESWSPEQALALLPDPRDGLGAAVRLIRLSGLEPLCTPAEMTDETASRLRLLRVSGELWALGLADRHRDSVLHAPVLLTGDGVALTVADGTEEELLCLHVAQDSDVFPHLLMSPRRVWTVQAAPEVALALESPACLGFCWRQEQGFPYVGLLAGFDSNFAEITRYLWEPYELAFTGPAADKLPNPPGGKFQLDMLNSPRLIPMGGEIPEPKPKKEEPPHLRSGDLAAARAPVSNHASAPASRISGKTDSFILPEPSAQEIMSSGEFPCWPLAIYMCT